MGKAVRKEGDMEEMKVGNVYYAKHTVVGISKRTGTVSETSVEIVKVMPLEVLDEIRAEIEQLPITDTAIRLVTAVLDKRKAEIERINEDNGGAV